MKILVTPRSLTRRPSPELEPLAEAGYTVVFSPPGRLPAPHELAGLLPGCVGYLAGIEPITASVLDAAPQLRVISRNGTGVDNIDLTAAQQRGITVIPAVGANARGVAELTIALILAAMRDLPRTDSAVKKGSVLRFEGREVAGRVLGIVGCGAIGRLVAQLGSALGMTVRAYDVRPDPAFQPSETFEYASLPDLLDQADVVTLHAPPAASGGPIIGAAQVARLHPDAILINTARASLVDADAVHAALERGNLYGYATDTADETTVPRELLAHPRTIATPHIGAYTVESVSRATAVAVENLLSVLRSRPER